LDILLYYAPVLLLWYWLRLVVDEGTRQD